MARWPPSRLPGERLAKRFIGGGDGRHSMGGEVVFHGGGGDSYRIGDGDPIAGSVGLEDSAPEPKQGRATMIVGVEAPLGFFEAPFQQERTGHAQGRFGQFLLEQALEHLPQRLA